MRGHVDELATTSLAGALLLVIAPVEPSIGREYIGRVFAITVLGGMGSIGGTLVAALIPARRATQVDPIIAMRAE